jgi:17beta-estradiol 17-dehydrogenase / very-long-chain 3-oxoacyl-CoA reductase
MWLLRTVGGHVAMAVGLAYLAKLVWSLICIVYRHTAYRTDWALKWGAKGKGSWAVVTGATDGIGREYAVQLAKMGYSVLVVGRTAAKLSEVAQQIAAAGGAAQELVVDFSHATQADYARVSAAVEGKDVRVLVNNVGVSYPFPEYLHLQSHATLDDVMAVNASSMIHMTRAVVPGMLETFRRTKARSLVYNVGSFSHLGAPLLGAYAGSKGFVYSFSESLRADYAPLGVDVVHFHPLFVATRMAKVRSGSLLYPAAHVYAERSLIAMNDKSGNGGAGYLMHDLAYFVLDLVPRSVLQFLALRMHRGLRSRAYVKNKLVDPLKK